MMNHSQFISLSILMILLFVFQQCTVEGQSELRDKETVYTAVEEIRIGQFEGEDEYVFGAINHITIGKDGAIFVADYQVPIIRMYNKDGKFIRNVGREGRGPGEYRGISGMRTLPDGRLAIWNVSTMRIIVYDEDGDFIENYSVNSTLNSAHTFEVDHLGNFYVNIVLRNTPDMPNWEMGWLRISPEGDLLDTLKIPLDEEVREQSFVLFTATGRAHPFLVRPLVRLSTRGYLITGRNDNYRFALNVPDTDPKIIEREYSPIPLTPEEKVQWRAWINYYGTNNPVPEFKPPYKDILTDSQGRIWIQRYAEAVYTEQTIGPHFGPKSNWWEPPTFDVFLPDGTFYATVILPLNAHFRDAKDHFVWALLKGEHDEQYVARFRLEEISD